jgi:transglutaminase-like putative cysteine protease
MQPDSLQQAERLTLGVLICGVVALSLSSFVDSAYWLVVMFLAALRLWRGGGFFLSERVASLIGWGGFFWVGFELLAGRDFLIALTDFLLILSLAVTVEEPTPRNHLHRMIVGLFLVLAAAVLTDSVFYIIPLSAFGFFMWRAARCLYGIRQPGGDLAMKGAGADITVAAAIILASTLLFVTLPRYGFGSILRNVQLQVDASGFTDRVRLGDFARELDATVMMRLEPVSDEVKARRWLSGRYWRGIALSRYTGKGWSRFADPSVMSWSAGSDVGPNPGHGRYDPLTVAVFREAVNHSYVMLPDNFVRLEHVPRQVYATASGSLIFAKQPRQRLRLTMRLDREETSLPGRPPIELERKPPASDIIRSWASNLTRGLATDLEKLKALEKELKGWDYDLQAPIDDKHPVEAFITRVKRGHCELFASAMALGARSLGIPARVVNGYYGGEWNDVGGFLLIRQQHAHAWVEAWLEGRWQRFDPTPASRWLLSGVVFPAADHLWEAVKLGWYRYVLAFEARDRLALWEVIKQVLANYIHFMGAWLVALMLLLLAWHYRTHIGQVWARQGTWDVLDKWLLRRGRQRRPGQPLRRVLPPAGIPAPDWRKFVCDWERQAYGKGPIWSRRELRRRLRALLRSRC